jgi:alanine-glyoxylate transaminase/serine-glyoxylate transaminase/serine-pyruvate transaminase
MTTFLASELKPSQRLLLGPGPSPTSSRVLRAMAAPVLGHLDPEFLAAMSDIQALLRPVFQTANRYTLAVPGTGTAAMEAALVNVVEPGDAVIVGTAGYFGARMGEIVGRCGGKIVKLEVPWGQVFPFERIAEALKKEGKVKAVALVHAETSTGAQQPLDGLGQLCQERGALLVVDAVTSLGGVPVEVDRHGIDVCYAGSQKCIGCPPGLSPITFSQRAVDAVRARKTKVQSFYLDLLLLADYWSEEKRSYHHTAPISMTYGLREALRMVLEEGLEPRFARHRRHSAALMAGLAQLGCTPNAAEGHRLPTLNCVQAPAGMDEAPIRKALLLQHDIEIGGGLGPLAGKVWRIGLMGEGSRQESVFAVLAALEQVLARAGRKVEPGVALAAAAQSYAR